MYQNHQDIIRKTAKRAGVKSSVANSVLRALFLTIKECMVRGDFINFPHFGTFYTFRTRDIITSFLIKQGRGKIHAKGKIHVGFRPPRGYKTQVYPDEKQ